MNGQSGVAAERATSHCDGMAVITTLGSFNARAMKRGNARTRNPMRDSAVVLLSLLLAAEMARAQEPSFMEEATVAAIHGALASGLFTCVQVVEFYLDRIEAYDDGGPALNAILSVNPRALETARELDRTYAANRRMAGSLHCIPAIVKDNVDTVEMPTTGGSVILGQSRPPDDAFIVQRLRAAGAVILAKGNLTELARGGTTVSSLGGQTLNPYDLSRTPGGSSGGPAAAIAANFGVLGIGTDTGQSVRSPASANSLVGLRPTRGLISRDGIIPFSSTQDEAGPITRTVEDAARMLDVITGYDPADPITAFGVSKTPPSYTAFLRPDGMTGARIGLVTNLLGNDPVHSEVNAVLRDAAALMAGLGAEMLDVEISNLSDLTSELALGGFEFKEAFNDYLADLGPTARVKTLSEFILAGPIHPSIRDGLIAAQEVEDGLNDPEYGQRLLRRQHLRQAITTVMADNELDALLYPHQRRLVAALGEPQLERNGALSNGTGFPALTFPGGFSTPTASAPDGVPIGIELLAREWSEPLLLQLAYAFEHAFHRRKPPASTPRLDE